MSEPVVWTDPGGCSSCRHCGMDMGLDPYCAHPSVTASHRYGLNINVALRDFCRKDGRLTLREERGRMTQAELRAHVIGALGIAVTENGYTELRTWPADDVVGDLLAYDAELVDYHPDEIRPIVADWQASP